MAHRLHLEVHRGLGRDVYRNDFNIAPLRLLAGRRRFGTARAWRKSATSKGSNAMWDDLRTRRPGLTIDIAPAAADALTSRAISRSYPLWQSDTQCGRKPMPVWDQAQNSGLSLYVPSTAAGVWAFDPYNFRSVATTGCSILPRSAGRRGGGEGRPPQG